MNRDDVLPLVGLANRAGKIKAGSFLAREAVRTGSSRLIIVAHDASDNVKKRFKNACKFYGVKYLEYADKASLGRFSSKSEAAVISINDPDFAKGIIEKCQRADTSFLEGT